MKTLNTLEDLKEFVGRSYDAEVVEDMRTSSFRLYIRDRHVADVTPKLWEEIHKEV